MANFTLAANLMARAWNLSTELHTVTTIGAAKLVVRKWAQNLPVWTLSDLFPDGKEKPKTLVIKSIYQITIYLFDKIYIYIFLTFPYCKNKSLRLSDTVSLIYKNAKYITDQQQKSGSKKDIFWHFWKNLFSVNVPLWYVSSC